MKDADVHSINLLGIDVVAVSNVKNELDRNDGSTVDDSIYDELDCFFTITTKDGEVYLFEALSSEESHRIVTGIKNLAFRLSSSVLAGDASCVADFFDNTNEPSKTQLGVKEAMLRISNAFLDHKL